MLINEIQIAAPTPAQAEQFPFTLPLYRNGLHLRLTNKVTVIAGENGAGKSTFLEALAVKCGFSSLGGVRGHILTKAYGINNVGEMTERKFDNTIMSENIKIFGTPTPAAQGKGFFLRAEYMTQTLSNFITARNYLSRSHGEGIIDVIANFRNGLFILDEPETALSISTQLALVALINETVKKYDAQFIIVTHSPIIMGIPNADFMWVDGNEFQRTDYRTTPHFSLMKSYISAPDQTIKRFMQEVK